MTPMILHTDHLILMDKNNTVIPNTTAHKIAPHGSSVKSVLRLFEEMVKCDAEGVLKDVRKAIEGN